MKRILAMFMILAVSIVSLYTFGINKNGGFTDVYESCAPGVCHTHSDGVFWCHPYK